MFVIICLLLLLKEVARSDAVVASGAAADLNTAEHALGGRARRSDKGLQISLTGSFHERVLPDLGRLDASMQQPRGRTLAGKRKKSSVFRPNRPSAYLSLGKVRPFTGDAHPPPTFISALEARSFRRELILITDSRPRAAVQLYDNLAQLGLAHVLWLTSSPAICTASDGLLLARMDLHGQTKASSEKQPGASTGAAHKRDLRYARAMLSTPAYSSVNVSSAMIALAAASEAAASGRRKVISNVITAVNPAGTSADMGCVWYNQSFPDAFIGHRRLMMKRLMFLARAVRHGYNMLSLDTDVIVFREPYSFLKHPPYGSAHMLVGKSIRGGSMVNTGVMYFQNVSRTGPISLLLVGAVERNLRWLDLPLNSTATPPLLTPQDATKRGCWDQFLIGDSVLMGITGKLSLYYCARPPEWYPGRGGGRRAEEGINLWNSRHRAALGLVDRQNPSELLAREVTEVTDRHLLALVGSDSFMTSWANLTRPQDPQPLLSDEAGYRLAPLAPGGFAELFQKLLKEDESLMANRQQSLDRITRRSAQASKDMEQQRLDGGDLGDTDLERASSERLTVMAAEAEGCQDRSALCGASQGGPRRLGQYDDGDGDDVNDGGSSDGSSDGSDDGNGVNAEQSTVPGSLPPLQRDVEMLAYAADWLVGGWTQRGVLGLWDPAFTNGMPRQVFAHLVRAPGPTSIGKEAVRMQYGEYNWELAALVERGPFPFLGSANATEVPRVVALLPEVDTSTSLAIQWANMARGLVQLALVTGRRVVWPAVPCASKWVQPNPGSRRALPLNQNLRFLAHGSLSDGLMCTPALTLHQKCLFERLTGGRNDSDGIRDEVPEPPKREGPRGLLPIEFEMMLRMLPPSVAQPGPHNTVHLQGNDDYDDGAGGERPVMFDEPPRTEGITYVKAPDVAKALREGPLAAQPVLYMAQRTFLTQLDKLGEPELMLKYRAFRNECPALK